MTIKDLLEKWHHNNLTPFERLQLIEALEKGEGKKEFLSLWEDVWNQEKPAESGDPIDKKLEEIRFELKKEIRSQKTKVFTMRRWLPLVAASIASLLLVFWFSTLNEDDTKERKPEEISQREIRVPKGGKAQRILLPDSSIVWLNVDSKLSFPSSFSDSSRIIRLEGEGYFDVKEDERRPFTVEADDFSTHVMGTTFYISSYSGENQKVILTSGKVKINPKEAQEIFLSPEEEWVQSHLTKKWEKRRISIEKLGQWKEGLFSFSDKRLEDLEPELERWYGVEIEFEDEGSKNCKISGKPTHKSIWDLLESFSFITGLEYKVIDNKILLYGGRCN
ncbi:MAG: FecR domain-containing protein [Bacteroidota bacterium]